MNLEFRPINRCCAVAKQRPPIRDPQGLFQTQRPTSSGTKRYAGLHLFDLAGERERSLVIVLNRHGRNEIGAGSRQSLAVNVGGAVRNQKHTRWFTFSPAVEEAMRKTLGVLCFAAGIGLIWCQDAAAFPADPTALKEVAKVVSTGQQVQYTEHHGRHHVTKCYREFVIGRYACHSYHYW